MAITELAESLRKCAGMANFSETRIYNLMHEVGSGKISADNALHLLVEDYRNLYHLGTMLWELAGEVEK